MFEYQRTLHLNTASMEETIHLFFTSPITLEHLHGKGNYELMTPTWDNNRLKIKYIYPIQRIPSALHFFIQHKDIHGKFKAKRCTQEDGSILIKATILPNILGECFIKIKSNYVFKKIHNGYQMDFKCIIKIYLPDPFNRICHEFLDKTIHEQFSYVLRALDEQNIKVMLL